MPPLDFPASPITGATYTAPNGTIWVWDGAKWANGVYIGTAYAPINAPTFTGDARAVTPAAGDADTSVATTAFVAGAIPGTSYADNGGFAVNQRTYVSSTALAAGAFGHDRWKGGAGGCTYTFTASPPATTITITAGTLQQVMEGAAIIGGIYTLSWTGTAQGRVGAGSYAASPVTVGGIVAGTNTTIEFNAGTLGRVKFEAGSTATPWAAAPPQQDLARSQRFYQTGTAGLAGYSTAGQGIQAITQLPVTMRAVPAFVNSGISQTNCTGSAASAFGGPGSYAMTTTVTATGQASCYLTYTASADI